MANDSRDIQDASPAVDEPSQQAATQTSEIDDLRRERDDLRRERDDLYDRLLRTAAEFDNYRKRIDRERREQSDQAVTDLLLDLLLVVDDFERALTAPSDAADSSYRKGIELINAKLHDVLRRRQVEPIEAVGHDFDPQLHEAVSYETSEGHRNGEILEDLRRGYMRGDRLLRPSMVRVAKA